MLVHTPYLRDGQDWSQILPRYRRVILDKLEHTAGLRHIEKRIRFESWLTPRDIHDRYGVLNGAIYGLASHGRISGVFKPANRSPDVKRLYLAGGAAHPGPGMPLVLMSGWIAADALDHDRLGSRAISPMAAPDRCERRRERAEPGFGAACWHTWAANGHGTSVPLGWEMRAWEPPVARLEAH